MDRARTTSWRDECRITLIVTCTDFPPTRHVPLHFEINLDETLHTTKLHSTCMYKYVTTAGVRRSEYHAVFAISPQPSSRLATNGQVLMPTPTILISRIPVHRIPSRSPIVLLRSLPSPP